jgi:predicted GIY-YIG superfamily endonuclease
MYWQRDLIVWKNEPKLLGKQQVSSKPVDFSKQRGVYILYDHHTVIYIGRSTDRPLGKRLYEHTLDRLSGRWNRFSWFGLLDVTSEGNLIENAVSSSQAIVISTLESILIETLEPPQNRRRGDDLSAIEYIQHPDPKLKAKEHQALLQKLAQELEKEEL